MNQTPPLEREGGVSMADPEGSLGLNARKFLEATPTFDRLWDQLPICVRQGVPFARCNPKRFPVLPWIPLWIGHLVWARNYLGSAISP